MIVHTGEGRAFQTGVDVAEIATDGVGMERYRQSMEDFDLHFTAWHQGVSKPVITAVNGICAGGGVPLGGRRRHRASPRPTPSSSTRTCRSARWCRSRRSACIRKMPVEAVMRMALVGRHERMSAERAYELGMISEIVDPPERLRERAQELAETIARNSPAAMAATKRALWGALELGLTDACRAGAKDLVSMWGHPDQDRGPARLRREARARVAAARGWRHRVTLADLLFAPDGRRSIRPRRSSTPAASSTRGPRCAGGRRRSRPSCVAARREPRPGRRRHAAQRRRPDRHAVRRLAGGRRLRADQPPPHRRRDRARGGLDRRRPRSVVGGRDRDPPADRPARSTPTWRWCRSRRGRPGGRSRCCSPTRAWSRCSTA